MFTCVFALPILNITHFKDSYFCILEYIMYSEKKTIATIGKFSLVTEDYNTQGTQKKMVQMQKYIRDREPKMFKVNIFFYTILNSSTCMQTKCDDGSVR